MVEQTIQVKTNGQYKSLDVGTLGNGNHIIVTKNFATSKRMEGVAKATGKPYLFWSAGVTYNGEKCTFAINKEEQAKAFDECGGVDDRIKVTLTKEILQNKKGIDYVKKTLSFALA